MPTRFSALASALLVSLPVLFSAASGPAQEPPPWQQRGNDPRYLQRDDAYRQQDGARGSQVPYEEEAAPPSRPDTYPGNRRNNAYSQPADDTYRPPRYGQSDPNDAYSPPRPGYAQGAPTYGQPYSTTPAPTYGQPYSPPGQSYGQPYSSSPGYGQAYPTPPGQPGRPYSPPPREAYNDPPGPPGYDPRYGPGPRSADDIGDGSYSSSEILQTGHSFFGSVSKGLASVVEYVFRTQGRPNGYILGQEASGAFVAGLRYGEGTLYTKDAGSHRIYWQGPSIGYDAGAEGSKVMMLVYNLRDPEEIYQRFGGVDGSAYLVGGVGVTFQKSGDVIVAPIRAGVGLRLGANIGYLKYTRWPTWNPF